MSSVTSSTDTSSAKGPSAAARVLPAASIEPSTASRVASLAYGALAYVLFLGTFLYAIGFVTGLVVPKTVDDGARVSLAEALLVNGGFLALFAVQHTIMARKAFKRRWTRIVPAQVERSTFVLVTCAILIGMFWQWRHLPGTLWAVSGPMAWFLQGAAFLGWGIVLFSSFLIDHFELFGLRQVVRHFRGLPAEAPHFRERSLYRMVRHPLMLGFLLAFWATPVMSMGHLFFAAMCTGYILFGIQVEERSLVAEHGDSYLDYRRRVPMLLPLRRRSI
jgi:protein-S-isoprenylcysteine O-methyltransferase Ste14